MKLRARFCARTFARNWTYQTRKNTDTRKNKNKGSNILDVRQPRREFVHAHGSATAYILSDPRHGSRCSLLLNRRVAATCLWLLPTVYPSFIHSYRRHYVANSGLVGISWEKRYSYDKITSNSSLQAWKHKAKSYQYVYIIGYYAHKIFKREGSRQ